MRVLWLTNVPLPEASKLMGERVTSFGGWLVNLSAYLAKTEGVKLSVAFPKKGLKDVQILQGDGIGYYVFPVEKDKNMSKANPYFNKILDLSKPDFVHIFGTEYPHSLGMVNSCNKKNITAAIYIQGLVSICARHYMASVPCNIQRQFTFRDFIKQDNLKQQQIRFKQRGLFETRALKRVKHIIGRTTWDKACTAMINPEASYYVCNEILRDEFYNHVWDKNVCEQHSIFVSQGSYPIKGLHFILDAMPLILKRYPDAKLYVSGHNVVKSDTIMDRLKLTSYGKYIKQLIKKYDMANNIVFLGVLDEKEMCRCYLQSHVFASPSSIENSPNALGEAMVVGVPCVASNVGGVSDLITHRVEGFLYQADAAYMLAYYICEIFANDEIALGFSAKGRERALKTHDRDKNMKRLMEIYESIL